MLKDKYPQQIFFRMPLSTSRPIKISGMQTDLETNLGHPMFKEAERDCEGAIRFAFALRSLSHIHDARDFLVYKSTKEFLL